MSRIVVVPVRDLTPIAVTRARGAEAFETLMRLTSGCENGASTVLIDISDAKIVSSSFLDELVLRIAKRSDPKSPRFGFRVGSDEEAAKLEKVCSLRKVKCLYQRAPGTALRRTRIADSDQLEVSSYPGNFFD